MLIPILLMACSQETAISPRLESPPQVTIQSPEDGSILSEDDAIEFVGVVTDGNGLGDLLALSWSSDRDGELASAADARWDGDGITRFATTLTPGVHAISLSVTDSTDRIAKTSVSITVAEIDTSPLVEITSPGAFDSFTLGSDITLIGGASDPNQPPEELVATWTVEPEIGGSPTEIATVSPTSTGTVLSTWASPPVGEHRIRLAVVDGEGNRSEAQVVIAVEDPNAGDGDQDGWTLAQGDCDDNNAAVNPAADEACNDVDDDCNGEIDDKDLDNDNHIDEACVDYTGLMPLDDCDDADAATHGAASEQLDGVDNDCDGAIDNGLSTFDNDGDCACSAATCVGSIEPLCITLVVGDCDDTDPDKNPYDDDGDGYSTCDDDCDDTNDALSPADDDGDGFSTCDGDCDDGSALLNPSDGDGDGASSCQGDCNDSNASLNLLDNDGDGATTCGGDCNDSSSVLNPRDDDGDGYSTCDGDCNDASTALSPEDADGDGFSTCEDDCDDGDDQLTPEDADGDGYSTCEGDCDDGDDQLEPDDADGDGFSTCDGDCDDSRSNVNPDELENPYNGIDDDCVGGDLRDVDGDGYDWLNVGGTDCNDNNALVNPGRTETCNGIDDDCDTTIDENNSSGCVNRYTDADGDGYGVGAPTCTCDASFGAAVGGDCYDGNASARPGQTAWFIADRGDGSWDYDCSGVEDMLHWPDIDWDCRLSGPFGIDCTWTTGWIGGRPDCGESAEWNQGCYWIPAIECNPSQTAYIIYDQECH